MIAPLALAALLAAEPPPPTPMKPAGPHASRQAKPREPLELVRVERGKEVVLKDGFRLHFVAHGHKRTMVGGPASPLILHLETAAAPDAKPKAVEVHLFLDEARTFEVEGRTFELRAHAYDAWMELAYFGVQGR